MTHQAIINFREGMPVHQCFVVRSVETRADKTGKPFLSLVLFDKSGTITARVWSRVLAKCPGPFSRGHEVAVKGQVDAYKGELQVTVDYINTVEALEAMGRKPKNYDPELLYPATPYDRQHMWKELWDLAETNLNPPLRQLVLGLLSKYEPEFLVCPAARFNHHPYLGGLLEHTWSVARHAHASLAVYPDLNPELALAGAILHDLGKVKEFTQPQAPERTVPGELLGHIVMGWEMVREEALALEFPDPQLLLQLEHIILSHHGSLEFGSPVLPKTREALLVFYLDDLDAKLKMMEQHLAGDTSDSDFTSFHRTLGRGLFKGGSQENRSEPSPEAEN